MNILGISAYFHDSAACLVQDGKISAAAQEERFTRIKHDESFPINAINSCLAQAETAIGDIDYVAFYEKPFLKFERLLETYLVHSPSGLRSFLKAMPVWLKQKIWIKEHIANQLNYDGPILFPEHHQSHAASAFFASPFNTAAWLTVDGVGEWTTTCYGTGIGNSLEIMSEQRFPHSLGLLYSAFTYYCGFKVNSGEYKLMGLAPYGEPRFVKEIRNNLLDLKADGSFRLNLDFFNYPVGLTMTNSSFDQLFGFPPRKPDEELTTHYLDMARSIQDVTEDIMLRIVNHVHQQTNKESLCLAGGVALNCVANGRILREGPFNNIWIQPAAGDAGGALGAALMVWFQYLNNARQSDEKHDMMQGSYLGPSFSNQEIADFLEQEKIPHRDLSQELISITTAEIINQGKVIGWFQGRMEFGPRALGSRSIFGDARRPTMQKTMNEKIKFRESFRPFAPAVLASSLAEYFDLKTDSPYMLITAPVTENERVALSKHDSALTGLKRRSQIRSSIPAVTHVDYSARVQSVSKDHNPLFHQLLQIMKDRYNCPVVINTSFNVRGEPIVCTPQDAYNCFINTNMDYLVIGGFIISKQDLPQNLSPNLSH